MLLVGVIEGIVGAVAGLLLGGVAHGRLDEHDHVKPNQGIRSSARNSMIGLLIGLVVFGVGFILPVFIYYWGNIDYIRYALGIALLFGVSPSLFIGLIIALLNG